MGSVLSCGMALDLWSACLLKHLLLVCFGAAAAGSVCNGAHGCGRECQRRCNGAAVAV